MIEKIFKKIICPKCGGSINRLVLMAIYFVGENVIII